MKTSPLMINAVQQFKHASTRPEGIAARHELLELLQQHKTLSFDFTDFSPTVSFVDESLGVLAEKMGKQEFCKRIMLKNASVSLNALITHILSRRLAPRP